MTPLMTSSIKDGGERKLHTNLVMASLLRHDGVITTSGLELEQNTVGHTHGVGVHSKLENINKKSQIR